MVHLSFRGNPWRNWSSNPNKDKFGTYDFDSRQQCEEIISNHVAWYGEESRKLFEVTVP